MSIVRLLALAAAIAGCGYTSEYTPPADGRARAVWVGDGVKVDRSGAAATDACEKEVSRIAGGGALEVAAFHGWWIPRYYGDPIVVGRAGLAPMLLRPPVFVPRLIVVAHAAPSPARGVGAGRLPDLNLGGGKDTAYVLLVAAAIALIVLPAVDLWMALDHPTSSEDASRAIDRVNVYNDLARWPGSPCAEWDPS